MCRVNGKVKVRAISLIDSLVRYANHPEASSDIHVKWLDSENHVCCPDNMERLLVRSDLKVLASLAEEVEQPMKVEQDRVRYILTKLFKDCLGILDDLRFQERGSKEWMFLLHLEASSREREDVVTAFREKMCTAADFCQKS